MRRRLRDQVERLLANDRALALIVAMESALDDDRLEARAYSSVLKTWSLTLKPPVNAALAG